MAQRLDLQEVLVEILDSKNVYFQPPPTVQLKYPCIIYKRDDENTDFADNRPYSKKKRYQITVIDSDPDSEIPDKVSELPLCVYDRFYTAEKLNHDVYKLFF
jgi:hypothetical protein